MQQYITWQEVCEQCVGAKLSGEGMGVVLEGEVTSLEVQNGEVNKVRITLRNSRRKFKVGGQWRPCGSGMEIDLSVPVSKNGGPNIVFEFNGCNYTLSPRLGHRS